MTKQVAITPCKLNNGGFMTRSSLLRVVFAGLGTNLAANYKNLVDSFVDFLNMELTLF